jgi:hypothetical protein
MNAVQAVYLAVSMLAGIVLAGFRSDAGHSRGSLAWGLATLVVALLCVGIVSHTFARHVVQVIPPVVALVIVLRGSNFGPAAAAPIFTFWLGVMANIWMFLLGIARIFTGTFTLIEIALTLVIGIA